jgi:hypothetical protein
MLYPTELRAHCGKYAPTFSVPAANASGVIPVFAWYAASWDTALRRSSGSTVLYRLCIRSDLCPTIFMAVVASTPALPQALSSAVLSFLTGVPLYSSTRWVSSLRSCHNSVNTLWPSGAWDRRLSPFLVCRSVNPRRCISTFIHSRHNYSPRRCSSVYNTLRKVLAPLTAHSSLPDY